MKCLVPDCQGYGTIFGIPPNKSLREKWQKALPFNITLIPNSNQGICVKHFRPRFITCNPPKDGSGKELFHTYLGNTSTLVDNAVPTLFSKHLGFKKKRPLLKGTADGYGGDENISKQPKKVFYPPPLISLSGAHNKEKNKDGSAENSSKSLQPPKILLKVVSSAGTREEKSTKNEENNLLSDPPKNILQVPSLIPLPEPQSKGSTNERMSSTCLQKPKKILFQVPPFISKPDDIGKRDSILVSRSKCNSSNSGKVFQVPSFIVAQGKKRIVVLKKVNNPLQTMKSPSPYGQRIEPLSLEGANDTLSPVNNSASQKRKIVPPIIQRSLLKRTSLCPKLDLKSTNIKCKKDVSSTLKSPKSSLKSDLSLRKNIINNTLELPQLLASNESKHVEQVNWPTEDSSCTVMLKSSQLETLSNNVIISKEKTPPKAVSPLSTSFKMDSSSPVIKEEPELNIAWIEDKKFSHQIFSVTSATASESITCHNVPNLSGNEVVGNAELNNISSSSKIGKKTNEAELKSSLQNRLMKKVCVIPVKEVLNRSLSKVRVRELIAEQFGLRVPYDSKLFKVFSYNLKKFKNNYKKRMYYREKTKGSLRRQRKNQSDKLAKTPLASTSINQFEISRNKSLQENLETKKSDLTTQKNIFEDSLMINSNYRKKRYRSLEKNPAKQKAKYVKKTIPEKFRINFLEEVRSEKGNHKCLGGLKNIYNIPTTITNVNEKSQLEVLCQTLIEALHRLQESETEGSQLNLIISIEKGDTSSGSPTGSNDIAENRLKNANESRISDGFIADENTSRVKEIESMEFHSLSYLDSNITSDLRRGGTAALKEKVTNQPLVNESDMQLNESLSLAASSGGYPEKGIMMNSDCNSCSEPTAVQMDIRHDHSYSPATCFAFKNPRFLVKIFENNAEGKKQYKAKVLMKPPSKKLIQKHENEKLKLQKRIYKLSMKIKTKNYHISEKNKKIKYLSNIICQQKGVKRIRFPKTLDEKLKKPEDFVENATTMDGINSQQNNFYSNPGISDSGVANENTYIAETGAPLALTDEVSFTEESFDKRFNQLYQSLAEIATSDT